MAIKLELEKPKTGNHNHVHPSISGSCRELYDNDKRPNENLLEQDYYPIVLMASIIHLLTERDYLP